MNMFTLVVGYVVSSFGGAVLLWLLIDKLAWGYLLKHHYVKEKKTGTLTLPMGVVERSLYTTAFVLHQPGFVAVWLALKVASQWNRWQGAERGTYNVFLIGSGLSLIVSFVGAWIVIGTLPLT